MTANAKTSTRAQRKRNYRIPFRKNGDTGQVSFPTIQTLFEFVRAILMDLVEEQRDENVFDSEVARFIYPGYPYAHQFKLGLKNVSNIVELTLLSRNLGIPMAWIQRVRGGEWSLKQALKAYRDRRGAAALAAQVEHFGSGGEFRAQVIVDAHDAALLGDVYALVIRELRPLVTDVRVDRKAGTFI